jgi:hypothetical protein
VWCKDEQIDHLGRAVIGYRLFVGNDYERFYQGLLVGLLNSIDKKL